MKIKDQRRQMESTSVSNLARHIAADLPQGFRKLLEIIKQMTGGHFVPVQHGYILNDDCSSHYYFSGTAKNDTSNNGW